MLEHTADVGLRVWAPDLAGMFAEAARALIAVMGRAEGEATHSEPVSLEGSDLQGLFVDWLSEILFLFEARDLVAWDCDIEITADPWRVSGVVSGPSTRVFVEDGTAVKAVTYHRLAVERTGAGWEARVYLDL